MTVDQSIERFGTAAFSWEFMSTFITLNQTVIEMEQWFATVPEVYLKPLYYLIKDIFPEFQGLQATEKVLHMFISKLHTTIQTQLEFIPDYRTIQIPGEE